MNGRDRLLAEVQPLSDLEALRRLLPTVLAHARLGGAEDAAWALRALAIERGWLPPKGEPRVLGARWARRARSESLQGASDVASDVASDGNLLPGEARAAELERLHDGEEPR